MSRQTVFRTHWQNQLIEIIDSGDTRSLYFGGHSLQSAMRLSAPHRLILSYTRFMMAPLLIDDSPRRILVVGVGAGSMIRFLHHHLPDTRIDGIDEIPTVIDLARDYFHLPAGEHIGIHCCSGFDFLAGRTDEYDYDLILIDAFDAFGMADTIYNRDFFELCLHHLSVSGIISANLWSGDNLRMEQIAEEIGSHFDSVLELPVPDRGNVILLAGRGNILSPFLEPDQSLLRELQDRFEINFGEMVKIGRKYNLGFFQRLSRLWS
jgi:spermidine synthase